MRRAALNFGNQACELQRLLATSYSQRQKARREYAEPFAQLPH
jgi:hypothetical protein